jgi:hypothetical protein
MQHKSDTQNNIFRNTIAQLKTPARLLIEKYQTCKWENEVKKMQSKHKGKPDKINQDFGDWGAFIYNSSNVGDDLQAIAQLQHILKRSTRVAPIYRENMHNYQGPHKIRCMMNGWFMHSPDNWPPNDLIHPYFVGFHCAVGSGRLIKSSDRDYYKRWGPIGCRDTQTVREFEKIGVDAYFSGCPTITLKKPRPDRDDRILVVDAHQPSTIHTSDVRDLLNGLVPKTILDSAEYLSHDVKPYQYNWHGYKLQRVHWLLKRYAEAKLVITSRLHCALPCLAFGTPVVFLHKNLSTDPRVLDYREVLHGYDSLDRRIDINWDKPEATSAAELKKKVNQNITRSLGLL